MANNDLYESLMAMLEQFFQKYYRFRQTHNSNLEKAMSKTALIIIDIQNDYFPGGALELSKPEEAAQKAQQILGHFRDTQQMVVHVAHENINPDLPFMLPGTEGQQIHALVSPIEGETVITKHYPNSFWKTELEQVLRDAGIESVVITGMMTHMCVSATTRAAMERGFNVTVVGDACTTHNLEYNGETIKAEMVHKTALAELSMLSKLATTDEIVE